jgi:hypothetical protein
VTEPRPDLVIAGELRDHPASATFAREVRRVHHRYAVEVVGAHRLCPFLRDPETAFGRFCVVLDREPRIESALAVMLEAGARVVHLVYPLVDVGVSAFERFGNQLHFEVAAVHEARPVHATFHPKMTGDPKNPSRLVGLLRRAPDPFVQFVPPGLHDGGTVFADPTTIDPRSFLGHQPDHAQTTFDRLGASGIDALVALLDDIRRDRDRSYASYLDALG